ncbi:MAG: hypothetical protein ACKVQW_04440 [Pyrinomonadaceae bacterium]
MKLKSITAIALFFVLLPVLGPSQTSGVNPPLKEAPPDFVGDGCTFFPDGDYADCCRAHDRDYYRGGTKAERKASDKRLRQCVRGKGHKYISKLMYLGVRISGGSWLRAPFSWGFGQRKEKNKKDKGDTKDTN